MIENMETKIKSALSLSPGVVKRYLQRQYNIVVSLISEKRMGEAITYFPNIFFRTNIYSRFLKWKFQGRYVVKDIHGSKMLLDIEDEGLSKQLIQWGNREDRTVNAFKKELQTLKDNVDSVTVLELGANIGYYVLIEASILSDSDEIYAIEPHPDNISHLRTNITMNEYDNVNITQCAVGDQDGSAELYESPKSNRHQVGQAPHAEEAVNKITVPEYTVDSFLREQELSADAINVVRMDVEGYEEHIFKGMNELLEQDSPMVLFIELHTWLLDKQPFEEIIDKFEKNGFELKHSFVEAPHIEGWRREYEDLSDIQHDDTWGPKLILTRGM